MIEPLLDIRGLEKNFGAVQATRNLNLLVKQGEIHAIIGPNGAGKTTLVNQITGDLLPDKGQIIFSGRQVTRLKAHQRARLGISRSFQITHIFPNLTVAENMAVAICAHNGHNFRFWQQGLEADCVQEQLLQALQRVDLGSQQNSLAGTLSHGEKRQLEVGMALVGKPKLLILDEPMAGMGPGGTVELTKLIKTLKGDTTILLVEHDMNVVFTLADTISVLVYGEHIATGTAETIRNDVQVQQAYLGESR